MSRRAKESPRRSRRSQEGEEKHRIVQEGPGGPRRAHEDPGAPPIDMECPGDPKSTHERQPSSEGARMAQIALGGVVKIDHTLMCPLMWMYVPWAMFFGVPNIHPQRPSNRWQTDDSLGEWGDPTPPRPGPPRANTPHTDEMCVPLPPYQSTAPPHPPHRVNGLHTDTQNSSPNPPTQPPTHPHARPLLTPIHVFTPSAQYTENHRKKNAVIEEAAVGGIRGVSAQIS